MFHASGLVLMQIMIHLMAIIVVFVDINIATHISKSASMAKS